MTDKPTELTHLTGEGHAHMVDVGEKAVTSRRATARARVRMAPETFARLAAGDAPKGDVLAAARIAGIQAAKLTPNLIPLCHTVHLTKVEIDIHLDPRESVAIVDATAEARDRTGVEMEAMVAASAAALTLYDMLKAIDRGMSFEVGLLEKAGGKTGHWTREEVPR
jgi:cyclic pyranopterin phosphate synthase